jgi:hypothetical protein
MKFDGAWHSLFSFVVVLFCLIGSLKSIGNVPPFNNTTKEEVQSGQVRWDAEIERPTIHHYD